MLRENPLVNTISILGTALSIAMILVIVLVFQINHANYAPESNRDRMLYIMGTEVYCESVTQRNRGNMSAEVVKECFYTLQTPEVVTAIANAMRPISLPSERLFTVYNITYTDTNYWNVFDFKFLAGSPFTEADFSSGLRRVVVSERTARELFKTVDVVGKEIVFDNMTYTICGVVKTTSSAAKFTSADVWPSYTSKAGLIEGAQEGMSGSFRVILLAKKKSDFKAIQAELDQQLVQYNAAKQDCKISFPTGLINQLDLAIGSGSFRKVPLKDYLLNQGSILLFLLLIPALNLVGIVMSSVRKRRGEIGLRKSFGATNGVIVRQILFENMVLTMISAILGFGLSFLLLHFGKSFMLSKGMLLTVDMLLKPGLFVAVLVFALLLNLLSAGLPALNITRHQIIDSLNDSNK